MSEDIRKMIDKVKNFKQFVNEQFITSYGKSFNSIQDWAYEYAKTNTEGFNSYE